MKRFFKTIISLFSVISLSAFVSFNGYAAPSAVTQEETSDAPVVTITKEFVLSEKQKNSVIEVYENFIKGNVSALYHADAVNISYFLSQDCFSDGKEYNLNELINVYQEEADELNQTRSDKSEYASISKVEYAILDDRTYPLLALEITGNRFSLGDYSAMLFLLRYDNASKHLDIIFGEDSYSRSRLNVNSAGIIISDGNSGAYDYSYDYNIISPAGKIQHLYSASYSNFKTTLSPQPSDYVKNTYLVSYYFDTEEFSPENGINKADLYTLHDGGGDNTFRMDFLRISDDNPAYLYYSKDGTSIVDNTVVARAILQRLESFGISFESFFSAAPLWNECTWEIPQITVDDIRKGISEGKYECGLGYVGGTNRSKYPEGEIDETICRPGMQKYGFMSQIPVERRLVFDGAELYCVVPRSEEDRIIIYGAKYNHEKEAYEETDLLYDSSDDKENNTGDPILLACNPSELFGNVTVKLFDKDDNLYSDFMPKYRPTTPVELVGEESFFVLK